MRKLRIPGTLAMVLLAFCSGLRGAPPAAEPPSRPLPPGPVAELSIPAAVILGTIEGVTEYLPVSSTGHLIIAAHALRLDSAQQLRGRDGRLLWHVPPSPRHPQGEPLTLKLAADTYTIVIQFGAIAAVALLYWRQLFAMGRGLLGRDPAGFRLARNLVLAFVPAGLVGFLLHDWIDEHLFSIGAVIAAQVAGALLIFWAEAYRRRRLNAQLELPTSDEVTPRHALNIGFLQCAALWPGTSRSMMTIVGGYLAGLSPRRAAEFSFLLGFVTLSAATCYKGYKSGSAMIEVFGWSDVVLGCVIATFTAALAVRFLVGWLSRHGMALFAWYRLAFAALLAVMTWM